MLKISFHPHYYVHPGRGLSEEPSAKQVEDLNLRGFTTESTNTESVQTSVQEKAADKAIPMADSLREAPFQGFIIGEARRGGRGWLMYDVAFRQQILSLETTDFSTINQSLYSTNCMAFGNRGRVCPTCMMADHDPEDCALHPSKSLPIIGMHETMSRPREERSPRRGTKETRARPREERRLFGDPLPRKRRRGVCFNFNGLRGCTFQNCQWEHTLSSFKKSN